MSDKNVWDYRVVRKESADGSDEWYSIQEVYYDDETGKPMAQTVDLQVEGDTITGMRTQLERMINCLGQPVIDEVQDASVSFPTSDDGVEGTWEEGQKYVYESPDGGKTIYRRKVEEIIKENMENLRTGKKTKLEDTTDKDIQQWKKDVLKRGGI